MSKAIYIAASHSNSGKSIVTLGLMRLLLGKTTKVGYIKPIITVEKNKKDFHIETILSHFDLDIDYNDAYVFTGKEVITKRNQGKIGEVIDTIIKQYKKMESKYDFVLVEGTDFEGDATSLEAELNVNIAKNLGIPALIISKASKGSIDNTIENTKLIYDTFKNGDVEVLSVVVNKVSKENVGKIEKRLLDIVPKNVVTCAIPFSNKLSNPTVAEIVRELDAEVMFGQGGLNNPIGAYGVGAMQLRNHLQHYEENYLVVTPGDRADIILGSLQANTSKNYPKVAGIVLTGGLKPEGTILRLIDGLSDIVPILSVKTGTFETATNVANVQAQIYSENNDKILASLRIFNKYVPTDDLTNKLINFEVKGMTPKMFQYNMVDRAQKQKKRVVLPEGNDARVLEAAAMLATLNIVDVTLLGDIEELKIKAEKIGIAINFDKIKVINPLTSEYLEDFVNTFYELRKHKGVNLDMARDTMTDVSYFGTMMVHKGLVDGMVSGAVNTTQHTIRPALQFIKTKPDVSVVSSVFFMCMDNRVSVFGDCAINPDPTAEQLAEIAISSADSAANFGIEPRVAMLSYSSGSSGKGAHVDKVRAATEIVKTKRPDLKVEGPIQYDAAVDAGVAKSKMPNSEVAGQATVLIFPDLNTGNNTYKAIQRETGALAIGPMLQGLNKPVNDLSRGCTVDDIFNTVIITAIQAQEF
ncbi:phosphate acetyltransferase [Wenyingzhuangia fucanilytica]|uniref:Phosphate acetyltransferase n=1 Tax=Wenyingzhuangia fucanilytica TaxID=1790137 RepID=A0A1B1Y3G4_9FLAO|nr:phosphate acetyltransferase [Wenyingzhuangia fucanilytica]ANW95315.1 phosphate acetyltransferase [Wenyingzhuangia fucanilytica]